MQKSDGLVQITSRCFFWPGDRSEAIFGQQGGDGSEVDFAGSGEKALFVFSGVLQATGCGPTTKLFEPRFAGFESEAFSLMTQVGSVPVSEMNFGSTKILEDQFDLQKIRNAHRG